MGATPAGGLISCIRQEDRKSLARTLLRCTSYSPAMLQGSSGPTGPSLPPMQAERLERRVDAAAQAAQRALEEKAALEKEAQALEGERPGRLADARDLCAMLSACKELPDSGFAVCKAKQQSPSYAAP